MSRDGLRQLEQFPIVQVSDLRREVGAGQKTGNGAPPGVSRDSQAVEKKP